MARARVGPTACLVLGLGLLQALWILTLPPFAASDEFDHAYRAAGVASGQVSLTTPALDGRGELVAVPRSLVEAASGQCRSLPYTGRDNCFPVAEVGGGRVLVATAAGTYHPAFYAVIGTLARPLEGAAALYAMRTGAALMCLTLIGAAAWLQCRRGPWVRAGLVLSLTPTLVYTTAVGAPNGLEIAAGILLWVALLELCDTDPTDRPVLAWWSAVLGACLLVTLRLLGPLFLVVVVGVVAVLGGDRGWRVVRRHPRHLVAGVVLLGVASVGSALWILAGGQLDGPPQPAPSGADPADESWGPGTVVVWVLQTIAAFPYRNQPGPIWVYPAWGIAVVALSVAGARASRGRDRRGLLLAVAAALLLPIALTATTEGSQGVIWQGRYVLPIGVGFVMVAARAVDRRPGGPLPAWLAVAGGGVLAAVVTACLVKVRAGQLSKAASQTDPSWWAPHPVLIAVVAVVAAGLLTVFVQRDSSTSRRDPVG